MKHVSYSEALRLAMTAELNRDDNVFLLGEDIGVYGGAFGVTRGMLKEFGPERIINTPISEGSFTGVAIGAALMGSRPIVEIMFMDFITLAVDQLVNQAAKVHFVYGPQARCPLVVRAVGGGGRNYGPTHSQNLESWFAHTPGLKVVAASSPQDAYTMMKWAIRDNNPVIFLEHKLLYPLKNEIDTSASISPPGTKRIKDGEDLTLISYSYMTVEAQAAASVLEQEGISVDLLDVQMLNPLDDQMIIESAQQTGRVIIVSENNRSGSVAAEIACRIFENVYDYLDAPIERITLPDIPVPASSALEHAVIPGKQEIIRTAREIIEL